MDLKRVLQKHHALIVSNRQDALRALADGSRKDIDVVVHKVQLNRLIADLELLGFKKEIKRRDCGKVLFHKWLNEKNELLMVDVYVHYVIMIGNRNWRLRRDIFQKVFDRAELIDGLYFLSETDRLLWIFIGLFLKKNKYASYRNEISKYEKLGRTVNDIFLEYSLDTSQRPMFFNYLAVGECKETALYEGERLLKLMLFTRVPFYYMCGWFLRVLPYRLEVFNSRPTIVAIVGLDGSGKSSLVDGFSDSLGIKVKNIYWGSRYMVLPTTKLFRLLERKVFGRDIRVKDSQEVKSLPRDCTREKVRRPLIKRLGLALLQFNKYAEYLAKAFIARVYSLCGYIVLADRYVYDEFLEYEDPYHSLNRLVYSRYYPKPDLLVLAYASPETICSRKPTIALAQAEHHIAEYKQIVCNVNKQGVRTLLLSSDDSLSGNMVKLRESVFTAK